MSAVNVFVSTARAVMLTDASFYQPDGTIIAFEAKAFPVASWNGAVSGRGNCWGMSTALALAEAHGSFDAFIALSAPIIEREHRGAIERGELAGQTLTEIHVIGWSERQDRAKAFVLNSPGPVEDPDRPSYVWRDLEDGEDGVFQNQQLTIREQWILHRQGAEPYVDYTAETFDPVRHGIPLMEMQRQRPADVRYTPGLPPMHVIGGHVLLTIVDREGVRQGVIHEWPDVVGEPIRPAPIHEKRLPMKVPSWLDGVPLAQFERDYRAGLFDPETLEPRFDRLRAAAPSPASAPMTRQQRRAAEAKAKKVRKGLVHV